MSKFSRIQILEIILICLCNINDICGKESRIEPIDAKCLTCICFGASGCGKEAKCDSDVCGMFAIGYDYWSESGQPTLAFDDPTADGAYMRCASDLHCAARTVENHMNKFPYDCNADRKINCWDYAGVHNRGYIRCADFWDIDFDRNFQNCMTNKTMIMKFITDY
ncbi:invertebrate-type lysozyme 3 [Nilaparvata lugens]|uniref:invertebrate-type lysozyme 3 n=1 Tax=Nilaparvata lugens TaxID=108931 RepID=UPI00193DBC16|nr:invertebrate-type lysozyme 3 [Nilaparvata lugens]